MEKRKYVEGNFSGVKEYRSGCVTAVLCKKDTAFTTYTIISEIVHVDDKEIELKSDKIDIQQYYIGKFYTLQEIAQRFGEDSVLYNNLCQGKLYIGACEDAFGKFHAVRDKDVVLLPGTVVYSDKDHDK